ncbi:MAG TPA: ABC transporter permease [Thermoanaerobaculia bacterium]|jgi:putative ABC transport system permease protein|nr:ABC transporter permease [Thermoanaerobaculia bacterium]
MGSLWKNLQYGLRTLLKAPGFTLVAVLTLALGIGTNAAVFSIIDAVLFRPYPYKAPDRLAVLRIVSHEFGFDGVPLSYPDYAAYKEKSRSFEDLAAIAYRSMNVGNGETATRVRGVAVSANLFNVVGTRVISGRGFLPAEDRAGGEKVAVLSEQFWQTRLGSKPGILGQTIHVDGEPRTVVGIVESRSQLPAPNDAAIFLPIALDPARESWTRFSYFVLGRLKPGVSLATVNAELRETSKQVAQENPEERKDWTARVISLRESRTGDDRPMLLIGFACGAFVLLIACINVANLLVQRGAAKQRDLAVRTALGASRSQIFGQLLVESCLLAFLGTLAGLVVSVWLLRLTVRVIPPEDLPPYLNNFALNGQSLLYMLGVAVFTVLVFGLVPALRSSRPDLKETLNEGSQGAGGSMGRQRFRNSLVVVEVALSMILLVVCGLLIGSLFKMVNVDTGLDRHHTLLVDLTLPETRYAEDFKRDAFYRKVIENVRNVPGISGASLADNIPFGSWGGTRIEIEGLSQEAQKAIPPLGLQTATEDYFQTIRQNLVAGRGLQSQDTQTNALPVVVINARTAKKLFADKDPLGQKIKLLGVGKDGKEEVWATIVGVTENILRRGLSDNTSLEAYVPAGRFGWPEMVLLAHVDGDPLSVVGSLRQAVQAVDPGLAVVNARTLDKVISDSFTVQRVASILCGLFGVFALVLAAVGMYGSLNYTVQQRTREIGIRMALGAQRREVISLVIWQILKLVAIGLFIGLLGSFALSKVMAGTLFGVGAGDLLTVLAVALVLTLVGLVASWIPARRASLVPPVVTLRAS